MGLGGILRAMMVESEALAAASARCGWLLSLTIWLFTGTSQREGIPSLPKGKIKQHLRLGGVVKTGTGGRESWPLPLAFSSPPLRVSTGDNIYCNFCALKSLGKPRGRREGQGRRAQGPTALTFSLPRGRPSFRGSSSRFFLPKQAWLSSL